MHRSILGALLMLCAAAVLGQVTDDPNPEAASAAAEGSRTIMAVPKAQSEKNLRIRSDMASDIYNLQLSGVTKGSLSVSATPTVPGASSGDVVLMSTNQKIVASANNGGSPHLVLTPAGPVGFGKANPNFAVDSASTVNADVSYSLGAWLSNNWSQNTIRYGGISAGQWDSIGLFTSGSEKVRVDTNGNVGIGTATPAAKLHVSGTYPAFQRFSVIDAPPDNKHMELRFGSVAWGDFSIAALNDDGSLKGSRLHINPNGYVGVGTTTPGAKLHVSGTFPAFQRFSVTDGTANNKHMEFRFGTVAFGDFSVTALNDDGSVKGNRLHIDPTGRVGIGRTDPAKLLHVAGDIQVDGNINAKFQDIAEWVPATEELTPGTVVVVAAQNHVAASTEAYDTRVAGVVSPRPGLTLGEAGESKVLVATTGRVKVRVDASSGPIREGDILVSSPIKGTAMRSEPLLLNGRKFHQPGTLIGKALEPLEKGTGEILVLLSLQ